MIGSRNERLIKRMTATAAKINALEEDIERLSDDEMRAKTAELRQRAAQGEKLDSLLPEAFATVREAGKRVLNMRHFDVQLIGGMVLHNGKIAEMRTGEGKTLVATLAAYLNALTGDGVHVVTVNDYLARRDAQWMGPLYEYLGMSTGIILGGMEQGERQAAYAADITYGTNNEFGFDYLRDNMAFSKNERFQRGQNFAIVDEVDSILIDEARTPLIISGPAEDSSDLYLQLNAIIPGLKEQVDEDGEGDYTIDEKARQVYLTEDGHQRAEELLVEAGILGENESMYDAANIAVLHHLNAGLRAHVLFKKDVDYIVKNGEVIIVDQFTGRMMPGRRWSEGLHQAVEAKEGVAIQIENHTLASITFQNYFRLYDKLSGMTGTADTEAYEFQEIYRLEVVVIPTHKPMVRDDMGDLVYLTKVEKYDAIIADVKGCQQRRQPVLVGTASIDASEHLSGLLQEDGISHQVLNAKFHEKEAQIVAEAGRPGAVTIATNMAGRGTDIVLGGNPEADISALSEADAGQAGEIRGEWEKRHQEVIDAGGLHIIGTERHESRRIDNQLRGRSGRQGDPGSSRFYLSLEDDLMRIFARDWVSNFLKKIGMEQGDAIEHPMITRQIANAQKKVEGHNFDIRKHILEFDDVANDQRKVIYEQRRELMDVDDISDTIEAVQEDVMYQLIDQFIPPGSIEEMWDVPGLSDAIENEYGQRMDIAGWLETDHDLHEETLRRKIIDTFRQGYLEKEAVTSAEVMRHFEKAIMLQVLDQCWKDHLAAMDYLRQGIGLRGYAQKNPKQEYKREAFEMFAQLLERIKHEVVSLLARVQVRGEDDVDAVEQQRRGPGPGDMHFQHEQAASPIDAAAGQEAPDEAAGGEHTPFVRDQRKIGRNEPCPCGSGKKYKQCHGKLS